MPTLSDRQETTTRPAQSAGWTTPSRGRQSNRGMGMDATKLARGLGWFSIGLGAAELLAPKAIARIVGSRNHSTLIRSYGLRELAAGIGILTSSRQAPWVWARVAGDMVDLASLGGVLGSPKNDRDRAALNIGAVTAVTVLDVMCAQKLSGSSQGFQGRVEASLMVGRSPEECYGFWRNLENLPRFMEYLQSVRVTGDRRSHWVANVAGARIEWDAEIESDVPNERISWRSVGDADVAHAGSVEFERAPGGRGTIVRVQMDYGNMFHTAAAAAATLLGKHPEQLIRKELRRFKQVLETGEAITTEGQPAGRRSGATWLDNIAR